MIKKKNNNNQYKLTIYKSNKHIYIQLINILNNKTIFQISTISLKNKIKKNKSLRLNLLLDQLFKKIILKEIKFFYFINKKNSFKGKIKFIINNIRNKIIC